MQLKIPPTNSSLSCAPSKHARCKSSPRLDSNEKHTESGNCAFVCACGCLCACVHMWCVRGLHVMSSHLLRLCHDVAVVKVGVLLAEDNALHVPQRHSTLLQLPPLALGGGDS